jgi:hypothetical protein
MHQIQKRIHLLYGPSNFTTMVCLFISRLVPLLLILNLAYLAQGVPATTTLSHHNSPSELNVASKSCEYDSRTGFAGDIGENHYSVDYYYTLLADTTVLGSNDILLTERSSLTSLSDNSIHNVVFQIELGIGSFLLRESEEFQSAPCHMRRLVPKTEEIRNVGLVLGPDDAIVATCESNDPTVSCYWIAGSFQVYTIGSGGNTTTTEQNIHNDLRQAMNGGALNDVHRAILNITYMESLPSNAAHGATTSGQPGSGNRDTISSDTDSDDRDGDDATIIVSSSVGAVLLVTAIAMVSRRRIHERTVRQASSMDISAMPKSQDASAADSSVV